MSPNKVMEKAVERFEKEVESFDLLVTFKEDIKSLYSEDDMINQIELALDNVKSYYIKETEFYNVVTLDLEIDDSNEIIQSLTESSPEFIEKAVPIDAVVPSISDNIISTAIEIAAMKMTGEESFTVNCELRSNHTEPLKEVTNKVPCEVCRKLNLEYTLETPDWMIIIEELGENTGIGICRPDEILIN
ncbi:THUMP domain-containing protein [Methanobacterium petrolearium]|uniref:THUMP domain-containing protein n=1 Tax=Methanobacterium petrolearium TaxID=710190 RepID=UPI001AE5E7D9|nr:THUMP domain-containing protein [Methanobacterium petrolearium]MBP1946213.1 tRNA acetyltransferase TAN1 [Methanobacterium petrolearium]BDZ71283.1 hypothetical protein GCM10025861_18000 [Methanobacterium petrolearium]